MDDPAAARPDPDALLRKLAEEEARARRGKLKIFFGFAPGVGKTYRMLQVARDLVAFQKVDLVIGIVETHKRYETAALMLGLEILPRRKIDYRGRELEEFDLDAALARRPKLCLVDELAHTNAAGSRHAKRWQDVIELLDAGIDVFTSVNVQHVESLNDVIAQITSVQVRETIPDAVLERADEVELVDIAPEELLERLKEGKVYLPDQARRAAEHFFQRGNMLALRELALRHIAQHVDEDVLAYRREHGVTAAWPAGERVLVCVSAAPSSGRLVRAAARIASGLRCPWVAASVEATSLAPLSDADRDRLDAHLRLAESLGASIARLSGTRVSDALLAYAREHNVTRIVLGKPMHSRVWDRLRGSLVDEVVRGSADIDVHIISGLEAPGSSRTERQRGAAPRSGSGYAAAALVVAATLGIAALLRATLALPDLEMLFLLAVMISAVGFGRGPALVAATLGVAAYNFFFVPPLYTFNVADRRYFLTFAMMFGVGLVLSELTTRLRRQEQHAVARESRTAALYSLSRDLAGAADPEGVAAEVARHASDVFGAPTFVLSYGPTRGLELAASCPPAAELDGNERGVAEWSFEHQALAGVGTDTLPGAKTLCAPLQVGGSRVGVLALELPGRAPLPVEQRSFLEAFCRQSAFAFERVRLAAEARGAVLRAKAEEMRSSLLSAVSHDLRTPLAAITGAASSLRDDGQLPENTRAELLDSISDQADRLERLVTNLLYMTRLETGGVALKREWVPLEELVGSALTRLESKLVGRAVKVELGSELLLVPVDPILFEQLLLNLLENATKHTPPETPIEVRAARGEDSVVIDVLDSGPGLRTGDEEKVFEKFYRDAHPGVSGAGLGLAICRGIIEAHGGNLRAENRTEGGACFRVTLPITGRPPAATPEELAT